MYLHKYITVCFLACLVVFFGCSEDDSGYASFGLTSVAIGNTEIEFTEDTIADIATDASIVLTFSTPLDTSTISGISLASVYGTSSLIFSFENNYKQLIVIPDTALYHNTVYTLQISALLTDINGSAISPQTCYFKTNAETLKLNRIVCKNTEVTDQNPIIDVPLSLDLYLTFSQPINSSTLEQAIYLEGDDMPDLSFSYSDGSEVVHVSSSMVLDYLTPYTLVISEALEGSDGEFFEGQSLEFYTQLDSTFKFPEISDDDLLTKIQAQTFKYFWDYAHPTSGMIRERLNSGNTVTTGGTGFGIMAIIVGMERGFITRSEGIDRVTKIITFLEESDRYHGAWPHWINGASGETIPFSSDDDGGDIVETAFLIQGLLTLRQYLDSEDAEELALIESIDELWEAVEWDWYTQDENAITWHWSSNYGFDKNIQVTGWNEALIVYILAASSPTHSISKAVYTEGWARNGQIQNGQSYYNITLPLGDSYGGPLFFEHYSFLGLNPTNLSDQYADYQTQAIAHTQINQAYCMANPNGYIGYNASCWGLTASDNQDGYAAHSPTNDLGVITPTAAISSLPFTPDVSMDAIRYFYYILGDKLWGAYGFYDAFNFTENWVASSYLAIDQGPIIIMIENYRTGLLWNRFMSATEIQSGLDKLDFKY